MAHDIPQTFTHILVHDVVSAGAFKNTTRQRIDES
jgi:hypothetical protein